MIPAPASTSAAPAAAHPRLDEVRRALARLLPEGVISDGDGPLEVSTPSEPARLLAVEVIEDDVLCARAPAPGREAPFRLFSTARNAANSCGSRSTERRW
jgi:hypothetical protein